MKRDPSILIVEDEQAIAQDLEEFCREKGFGDIVVSRERGSAVDSWNASAFDALLLDLQLPGGARTREEGLALLKDLRSGEGRPRRVFIYSAHLRGISSTLDAAGAGMVQYFHKPDGEDDLIQALEHFVAEFQSTPAASFFVGSDEMRKIDKSIPRIVSSDLPVLIIGSSGDGKTQLAKRIAKETGVEEDRIEVINCAAIPESLFEGILFGHTKGSFTGAHGDTPGKLMTASGFAKVSERVDNRTLSRHPGGGYASPKKQPGVVILDELATLPRHFQAKLLSVLDGEPIKPIGYTGIGFHPHFRVLATTNEIEKLQDEDAFRLDLRKRLEGWVIKMPPLYKQETLIRQLAENAAPKFRNEEGHVETLRLSWESPALDALVKAASTMTGGVRELKNIIARAVFYAKFEGMRKVDNAMLDKALKQALPAVAKKDAAKSTGSGAGSTLDQNGIEFVVNALKNKLKEVGISDTSLVGSDVKILPYDKVGKNLKNANCKGFVQWCQIWKKDNRVSDKVFLDAIAYDKKSKTPLNSIWGNWSKAVRKK